MDVQIAGRHVQVTEAMERHIRQHIRKLPRFDDRIQYISVTLGMDSGTQLVEILAKCHRADLVAEAKGHDMYQCIDEGFARMQRQISRLHDKLVDHRARSTEEPA